MGYGSSTLKALTARLALRGGFDSETLSGNKTLTKQDGNVQALDPGGSARDVTLPTVTAQENGYFFLIGNSADAAENLVVKDAGGSTILTINQSEAGVVYVDAAGAWQAWGILTYAAS